MNITEALKHLQEGKAIKHRDSRHIFRRFIEYSDFFFYDHIWNNNKQVFETNYYDLYRTDQLSISVQQLTNWNLYTDPLPIIFKNNHSIGVSDFYEKGYTIKRLKTGEIFNNTNLSYKKFSLEDINANDWEILEKSK